MSAGAGLVHGLAGDLVGPDWPPLTDEEARWVGERWALPGARSGEGGVSVRWHSPRPLSAAGLIGAPGAAHAPGAPHAAGAPHAPGSPHAPGGPHAPGAPDEHDTEVFVKRHDLRVREPESLALEHRFARHLRSAGVEAPDVLRTPDGLTAVVREGADGGTAAVYEVHARAPGADLYRDAESWTGFRTREHARAAGELLARVHLGARGLDAPARPFGPIIDCDEIVAAAEPMAALAALVNDRPGLAAGLAEHPWRQEIVDALGSSLGDASRRFAALERGWTHGDWHPSNLTWSAAGAPVAVLDLGLSNRTTWARDIAIAIERSCVSWLDAHPAADLEAVQALLEGYTAVRPLSEAERAALPALTATAHIEFALSEVEYYGGVLGSPERAEVAYRDYLIGHARWFATEPGRRLLDALGALRRRGAERVSRSEATRFARSRASASTGREPG